MQDLQDVHHVQEVNLVFTMLRKLTGCIRHTGVDRMYTKFTVDVHKVLKVDKMYVT